MSKDFFFSLSLVGTVDDKRDGIMAFFLRDFDTMPFNSRSSSIQPYVSFD